MNKKYFSTWRFTLMFQREVAVRLAASPGGREHILTMVETFGLDPAMTVLDLGAGLGGATRTMCSKFGVWVTGFEVDEALAELHAAIGPGALWVVTSDHGEGLLSHDYVGHGRYLYEEQLRVLLLLSGPGVPA